MSRGIFRKRIDKVYPLGKSEPILCEREVIKSLDKDGVSVSVVEVEKSDLSSVLMPTREEFDLEEQLKAGAKLSEINVKGMIQGDNFESSAISAFNSLQLQIDSMSDSKEVETSKND